MPEMNGPQLAEALHKEWPSIRTLFTSGYTMDLIADHGVIDPGIAFLRKPWTREELAAKVHDVINAG
jgi:response regulator RpfG family c-di-GMP phosphodiesterase